MSLIPLGVITKPFGIRGEVRLRAHNPRTTWFDQAEGIWVRSGEGEVPKYYRVLECRRHKEFFLLSLAGVRNRDHALELRGLEVVVPEEELMPLEEGEYYWYQLIGLSVETEGGELLGEVIRLEETAPGLDGNDLLVVRGESGEVLIPVVEGSVKEIDPGSGRIVVFPESLEHRR